MTLEEAQQRILDLETQLAEVTNERDSLSQNNETLVHDLDAARTLNQKLFERVTQSTAEETEEPEEETPPTCEEFARSMKIF